MSNNTKVEKPPHDDGFWNWLSRTYRVNVVNRNPTFTKWNMEVAYHAGRESILAEQKAKTE